MLKGYQSVLYGTFVRATMYGIYVGTFAHCLRWLLLDDRGWDLRRRINWGMLTVSIVLFILSTTDLCLTLKLFVHYDDLQAATPRYNDILNALEKTILLTIDGVLIYRLWIVLAKSWRVISLPIVLWLGYLACGILLSSHLFLPQQLYVVSVFYACNIAINLYATSLIVYRILRTVHDIKATGHAGQLYRVTCILTESSILYTLTSILNLVASWSDNFTIGAVAEAINFSMAGIAFNLILIRVGQNRSEVDEKNRLDTQWVRKELSALRTNVASEISQGETYMTAVEECSQNGNSLA